LRRVDTGLGHGDLDWLRSPGEIPELYDSPFGGSRQAAIDQQELVVIA
jgi:hypothetical protein